MQAQRKKDPVRHLRGSLQPTARGLWSSWTGRGRAQGRSQEDAPGSCDTWPCAHLGDGGLLRRQEWNTLSIMSGGDRMFWELCGVLGRDGRSWEGVHAGLLSEGHWSKVLGGGPCI